MKRYRVWWIPQIPMKPFHREVENLATAQVLVETLADYDLFQFENRIKPDYANVGGIEYWDEDEKEWVSYEENEDDA